MVYRPIRYEQMMKAAEELNVRARKMFDGMAVYSGEKMFAYLVGEDISLKLSPLDQENALKIPGAEPLVAEPGKPPMKDYVRMPKEILDNFEVFTTWVRKSADYAHGNGAH